MKKTLCIDFDGVIHKYTSGWQGPTVIPDGIMDGAVEKITELSKTYRICIFTTRANTVSGEKAVMEFLNEYRVPWDEVIGKPIAVAYIDDRAIHFESWDSIEVNR